MVAEAKFAANAYESLARLKDALNEQQSHMPGKIVGGSEESGFGGMVTEAISGLVQHASAADAQTQGMATGKTELVDVVTAVAETQVAMETLVSVRDQIISAYEKIMQMPI